MNDEYTTGEHLVLLSPPQRSDAAGFWLRRKDFEIRDMICIQMPGGQRLMAFLSRQELTTSSSTDCLLRHGTGFMNIDQSRIGYEKGGTVASNPMLRKEKGLKTKGGDGTGFWGEASGQPEIGDTKGRWPMNLILMHGPGCERVGTKEVGQGEATEPCGEAKPFDDARGWNSHSMGPEGQNAPKSYGSEEVEDWNCQKDCPVRLIDQQSGELDGGYRPNASNHISHTEGGSDCISLNDPGKGISRANSGYDDERGASRFFYQAESMEDLEEYLTGLVGRKPEGLDS